MPIWALNHPGWGSKYQNIPSTNDHERVLKPSCIYFIELWLVSEPPLSLPPSLCDTCTCAKALRAGEREKEPDTFRLKPASINLGGHTNMSHTRRYIVCVHCSDLRGGGGSEWGAIRRETVSSSRTATNGISAPAVKSHSEMKWFLYVHVAWPNIFGEKYSSPSPRRDT